MALLLLGLNHRMVIAFAVVYQRFNSDGTKNGEESYISTMDDPIDTIVLTATGGDDFQIYAGRTNETFSVTNEAPSSISLDNWQFNVIASNIQDYDAAKFIHDDGSKTNFKDQLGDL